ncbi:UNVERIFIED_CONTAM: hypothetical protein FKN15_016335 [Acipenser sinensis]
MQSKMSKGGWEFMINVHKNMCSWCHRCLRQARTEEQLLNSSVSTSTLSKHCKVFTHGSIRNRERYVGSKIIMSKLDLHNIQH